MGEEEQKHQIPEETPPVVNPPTGRNRHWNSTWNNPPEDGFDQLKAAIPNLTYLVAGKETAPTTGTPHLQIFFSMKHPKTWRRLKAILKKKGLDTVSLRPVKKTPAKAAMYCKKDGQYQEHGTAPRGQPGRRTDLLALRDAIMEGKTEAELLTDDSTAQAAARFTAYRRELRQLYLQRKGRDHLLTKHRDSVLREWQTSVLQSLDA